MDNPSQPVLFDLAEKLRNARLRLTDTPREVGGPAVITLTDEELEIVSELVDDYRQFDMTALEMFENDPPTA